MKFASQPFHNKNTTSKQAIYINNLSQQLENLEFPSIAYQTATANLSADYKLVLRTVGNKPT